MSSISRKKLRIIVTLKLCVFTLLFFSKLKDFVADHNLFRVHNLPHPWESSIQNQVSKVLCISAMQCDCTFLMMTLAGCLSSHTLISFSSLIYLTSMTAVQHLTHETHVGGTGRVFAWDPTDLLLVFML